MIAQPIRYVSTNYEIVEDYDEYELEDYLTTTAVTVNIEEDQIEDEFEELEIDEHDEYEHNYGDKSAYDHMRDFYKDYEIDDTTERDRNNLFGSIL